jgi:endonuclease III related protein
MAQEKILKEIYLLLYKTYGPQGWWPLLECKGMNPTKTGALNGYHVNDYSYPQNNFQRFEIALGAILTQNTSWVQAEKAITHLQKIRVLKPHVLRSIDLKQLSEAIRPAGYFNQKAKKIKILAEFWMHLKEKIPERAELLGLWGIGPETADSILLYAFRNPVFVVDAYTKRIFSRLGFIKEKTPYEEIKLLFESNLVSSFQIYQEYHALIVEHAKRHCKKKPDCRGCVLITICRHQGCQVLKMI